MHTFQDTAGRTWEIALTIGAVKRVKSLLKIDLLAPLEVEKRRDKQGRVRKTLPLVTRLQRDPVLLVDTIFVLVQPQAEKLGVSDVEFGESLGGDAAYQAYEAFMGEWHDFFQFMRQETVTRALAANMAIVEAEDKRNVALVDRASEAAEAACRRKREKAAAKLEALARGPSETATSSQESSASIPSD